MDRAEFLARLPSARPPAHMPGSLPPPLPAHDLASLFARRLRSVDGRVHGPMPANAVASLVVEVIGEFSAATAGTARYLAWDDPGAPGIHAALGSHGFARVDGSVPVSLGARRRHHLSYHDLAAGVTGVDAGVAESGSIVLRSGPGRPRLAALAPPLHVAVLPVARLVRSLSDFVRLHPAAPEGASNLAIITGPSRTADIEQVLNLGVHGPKHLHVILVA